jgi:hypothetical protein
MWGCSGDACSHIVECICDVFPGRATLKGFLGVLGEVPGQLVLLLPVGPELVQRGLCTLGLLSSVRIRRRRVKQFRESLLAWARIGAYGKD